MTNSADHLYSLSRDNRFVVRVSFDGYLKFVPTGTARTWCQLNLQMFPFDTQTCSIDFESWSLDSTMMRFNETAALLVDESFTSQQWALCSHDTTVYEHHYYTGETFTCLRYEFVIRRKSSFYVVNLIFPCATLSLIQLLAFIIPSTRSTSDRIGFGTTNLLTLVVFQTIVTNEMPKSNQFTALSKYVIALIVVSSFGIIQSIFVERMLHIATYPPPRYLFIALRKVSPFLPALWQQPVSTSDKSHATNDLSKRMAKAVGVAKGVAISVKKGILAGSSLLATAAVLHGKSRVPKRRQSKAAFLKQLGNERSSCDGNVNAGQRFSYSLQKQWQQKCYDSDINRVRPSPVIASPLSAPSCDNSNDNCCNNTAEHAHKVKSNSSEYASATEWLFQKDQSNDEMWAELATRIDALTLGICIALVVGMPMALFIPLAIRDDGNCSLSD